jgi:hypothetical protein
MPATESITCPAAITRTALVGSAGFKEPTSVDVRPHQATTSQGFRS